MPAGHEPSLRRPSRCGLQRQPRGSEKGVQQRAPARVRSHSDVETRSRSLDIPVRSRPTFCGGVHGGARPTGASRSRAMLVNEHSASAAEMAAAFASEYRLATLVGVKTAGRLVATSAFKVGMGYRLVLPVAAYYTWNGTNLEGAGVGPTIEEPLSTDGLLNGEDNQLTRAVQCLREGVAA